MTKPRYRPIPTPPVETSLAAGFERCLAEGWLAFLRMVVGLAVGWWIYVPVHELLHVLGCVATGGEVSRLEVSPLYGGHLLARIFPFVVAGGDYAGRLAGFDTGGSDLVYLATGLMPYVLTVFPGVPGLYVAGYLGRPFAFGFWLPVALAPFVSLGGDAYEIGSILVTQLPLWSASATSDLLRSDDLIRLVGELQKIDTAPWGGVAAAFAAGLLWAVVTFLAGRLLAQRAVRKRAVSEGE